MRAEPSIAFEKFGFFVGSDVYTHTTLGGPCAIACDPANGAVYKLTAKQGHGDYFFPYVHVTSGGVGVCIVPAGQPNGTMVMTGGMNGCALQVNRSGTDFYFYHDANGQSMVGKLTPGEVVCRVEYKSYAGPMNIGENLSIDYNRSSQTSPKGWLTGHSGMVHEYFLITVRSGGKWCVYCSALLRTTTRKTSFWTGEEYNENSFKPFMPTAFRLIASFEDE